MARHNLSGSQQDQSRLRLDFQSGRGSSSQYLTHSYSPVRTPPPSRDSTVPLTSPRRDHPSRDRATISDYLVEHQESRRSRSPSRGDTSLMETLARERAERERKVRGAHSRVQALEDEMRAMEVRRGDPGSLKAEREKRIKAEAEAEQLRKIVSSSPSRSDAAAVADAEALACETQRRERAEAEAGEARKASIQAEMTAQECGFELESKERDNQRLQAELQEREHALDVKDRELWEKTAQVDAVERDLQRARAESQSPSPAGQHLVLQTELEACVMEKSKLQNTLTHEQAERLRAEADASAAWDALERQRASPKSDVLNKAVEARHAQQCRQQVDEIERLGKQLREAEEALHKQQEKTEERERQLVQAMQVSADHKEKEKKKAWELASVEAEVERLLASLRQSSARKAELQALEAEVKQLEEELVGARQKAGEADALHRKISSTQQEQEDLQRTLKCQLAECDVHRKELDVMRSYVEETKESDRRRGTEMTALKAENGRLIAELDQQESARRAPTKALQKQLEEAQADADASNAATRACAEAKAKEKAKAEAAIAGLQEECEELDIALKRATLDLVAANQELEVAKRHCELAKKRGATAAQEAEELEAENEQLQAKCSQDEKTLRTEQQKAEASSREADFVRGQLDKERLKVKDLDDRQGDESEELRAARQEAKDATSECVELEAEIQVLREEVSAKDRDLWKRVAEAEAAEREIKRLKDAVPRGSPPSDRLELSKAHKAIDEAQASEAQALRDAAAAGQALKTARAKHQQRVQELESEVDDLKGSMKLQSSPAQSSSEETLRQKLDQSKREATQLKRKHEEVEEQLEETTAKLQAEEEAAGKHRERADLAEDENERLKGRHALFDALQHTCGQPDDC
eukprot:TRINITY_DN11936_c0_g1_i9.p1 TRINITY_DN11936_c0_g1~~TRINITY_DN11936_c0_g1_i9.p1  ORF type:complete len:878 (-),score=288.87 TRINITY_DN11936_c0_g1_i9:1361-3994(-)